MRILRNQLQGKNECQFLSILFQCIYKSAVCSAEKCHYVVNT